MQPNNLLLPLNDGVPETVNDATGAPIPTSLTALTSDPYRGLEYSILKNKSSKLFTTANNITGAVGAATPGLDKMTGFYSDFLEAAAYRDADNGRGLPYLSPGDIALATQWNLDRRPTTRPCRISPARWTSINCRVTFSIARCGSQHHQHRRRQQYDAGERRGRRHQDRTFDGARRLWPLHRHHRDQCRNGGQSDHRSARRMSASSCSSAPTTAARSRCPMPPIPIPAAPRSSPAR